MAINVREGTLHDLTELHSLIKELAAFEGAPEKVTISMADLEEGFHGEKPAFDFKVAEEHGFILGAALFYETFSTWKGRAMHLEDIIVKEKQRFRGIGKALMDAVIREADAKGARRLSWQVLDWNVNAQAFFNQYYPGVEETWYWYFLDQRQIQELSRPPS